MITTVPHSTCSICTFLNNLEHHLASATWRLPSTTPMRTSCTTVVKICRFAPQKSLTTFSIFRRSENRSKYYAFAHLYLNSCICTYCNIMDLERDLLQHTVSALLHIMRWSSQKGSLLFMTLVGRITETFNVQWISLSLP